MERDLYTLVQLVHGVVTEDDERLAERQRSRKIRALLEPSCNTCGDTRIWSSTLEDAPTILINLGPCPDCNPEGAS